jgi:hypothetical protein
MALAQEISDEVSADEPTSTANDDFTFAAAAAHRDSPGWGMNGPEAPCEKNGLSNGISASQGGR